MNIIKRLRKMNEAPPRRFRCFDEVEIREIINHVGVLNNMLRETRAIINEMGEADLGLYTTKAIDGTPVYHSYRNDLLRKIDICLNLEELDA